MKTLITQGVVIRAIDYSDNDKIITIFTPEHGKISAILHGVKKVTAKMKFASQPFCFAQFKLTGSGELLTVSGATEIESFFDITQDYRAMVVGSAILEMVDSVSLAQEQDHLLFSQLLHALKTLVTTDTDPDLILMRFAIGVFKVKGYALNLATCTLCHKPLKDDIVRFDTTAGEFHCIHCPTSSFISVSPRAFDLMQKMSFMQFADLGELVLNDNEATEFRKIIRINFALRFNKDLKSLSIYK